jgi:nitrate reductase beta subunit
MRISPAYVVLVAALSIPAYAASVDEKVPDEQSIHALELRAAQAQPKDQCFLYAQLVHEMIEYSAQQYAAGDVEKASGLLKRAQEFTHRIRKALAGNDKKLKDAQILLRHTAFRLSELLHASSYEDRPLVQETLAQLNQTENDAMMQVFKK